MADHAADSFINWYVLTFYLSFQIKYILFRHVGESTVWPIIANSYSEKKQ